MNDGMSLYLTLAEWETLLGLSDGPARSIYRAGDPPDDAELTRAMASLYRRGLLVREGGSLRPARTEFRELCGAPRAVVLEARYPQEALAVCYGGGGTIWVAESLRSVLSERIRVGRIERAGLEGWLFRRGILTPPLLLEEDARELSALLRDGGPPSGPARLRLESHVNGGELLGVYEVLDAPGPPRIRLREDGEDETVAYTAEALRSMLDRCFGKDDHDHREHQSPGLGEGV